MPRAKSTKTGPKQADAGQTDAKQDALNSLVSGDGGEADDKTQTTVGSTVEDTTPTGDQADAGIDQAEGDSEGDADPRDAALQGLVFGAKPTQDAEPEAAAAPVQQTGRVVKIGAGKSRAIVAADMYTGLDPDGVTVTAWKGDTVVISGEKADRGIRLGLLTKA